MHRTNWRRASRAAAAVLAVGAVYGASSALAETGIKLQATSTSPDDVAITGKPIITTGTEGVPSPGNNECYARLFKPKAASVPEELKAEDDIVVQYRIRCSSPISAFSVAFDRDVNGVEAEYPVTRYADNGITPDQAFNCGGETPGAGVSCVGTYKGGFNTIRGLVALQLTDKEIKDGTPFCKLGLKATLSTFTSQFDRDQYTNKLKTTKTVDGTTPVVINFAAGPYRVTTPACHRGAKSAKAKR